jgi:acyl-CoA thioester hydrolase
VHTWIENVRRAQSLRKYEIRRAADDVVLATGETEWVYIDAKTGRPLRVPEEFLNHLPGGGNEAE